MSNSNLTDFTLKTIELLSKTVTKTPLTAKLLGKPPFRYLHDLISEVIRNTKILDGLYTDEEMSIDNIKDKSSKIAYLSKLINRLSALTGTNLKVNPSKIVAGLEPEETNNMLQLLGMLVSKKIDLDKGGVSSATNGKQEEQQQAGGEERKVSKSARGEGSKKESINVNAEHDKEKAEVLKDKLGQGKEKDHVNERASEHVKERASEHVKERASEQVKERASEHVKERASEHVKEVKEKEKDHDKTKAEQVIVKEVDLVKSNDSLEQPEPEEPKPKIERPMTARAPPPKKHKPKEVEQASVAPVPITVSEDDHEFLVNAIETTIQPSVIQADDTNHGIISLIFGGLVQKILATKIQYDSNQSKPDLKPIGEKEIESTRLVIQSLCQSTNPLARTLDYLQEDMDAMDKELEMYKKQCEAYNDIKLQLVNDSSNLELENKLAAIELELKNEEMEIAMLKSDIYQNEETIAALLAHVVKV